MRPAVHRITRNLKTIYDRKDSLNNDVDYKKFVVKQARIIKQAVCCPILVHADVSFE